MIITKPVKLDEIEIGDIVVIKDDCKKEEYQRQALKVLSIQKLKNFEIVASNERSGMFLPVAFTLDDIFTVIHISL